MPVRTALLERARNSVDRAEESLETHVKALEVSDAPAYDPAKLATIVMCGANIVRRTVARRAEGLLAPADVPELMTAEQTINSDGEGE